MGNSVENITFRLWQLLSRRTLVFLLFSTVCQLLLFYLLASLPAHLNVLQVQSTWRAEDFSLILQSWSAEQRAVFLSHYWVDFVYPFCYSLFFYSLLIDLKVSQNKAQLFAAAGLFDVIENVLHLLLVLERIPVSDLSVGVVACISMLKWLLVAGFSILVVLRLTVQRREWLEK